jgi:hypothetical protein
MAAQVNHYLIRVSDVRAKAGTELLAPLPYTTQTTGAQLGAAFYKTALTKAPHASRPVSEDAALMRQLQSRAKFCTRQHIEAMTRTARTGEKSCRNGTNCVALRFCDSYNKPINGIIGPNGTITGGKPLVAFLFEDEYARQQVSRASMAAIAAQRQCIECMCAGGNALMTNLRFSNTALDARAFLAVEFYVSVAPGQYPIGATLGAGQRVFEGMLFNIKRFSEMDWQAEPCSENGDHYTKFTNTAIPQNPEPLELIEAFSRMGFCRAL